MTYFFNETMDLIETLIRPGLQGWTGLIEQGGVISVLLMVFAILGLSIIIEKLFALRRAINFHDDFQDILLAVKRNNDDQIAYELKFYPPAQAELTETAHEYRELEKDDILRELSSVASSHVRSLSRRLELLGSLGRLSPLLGLLGTVIGMMHSLSEISLGGSASPVVLGQGLTEALLTTAGGLIVGIPMIFFHNLFRNRVNSYAEEFEEFGQALVRAITYPAAVEFGQDSPDKTVQDAASESNSTDQKQSREENSPTPERQGLEDE